MSNLLPEFFLKTYVNVVKQYDELKVEMIVRHDISIFPSLIKLFEDIVL